MKLKKNVGETDKIIRYAIAIVALLVGYKSVGTVAAIAYVVAIVAAVTATLSFCGLYQLFGINTCKCK